MRFLAPAWIALALTAGCLRFGYGPGPGGFDGGFDSGTARPDAGIMSPDAAADGGRISGGGGMDAAVGGDASVGPVAGGGAGNTALDASDMLDAGLPDSSQPVAGSGGSSGSGGTDPGTSGAGGGEAPDPGTTDPVEAIWTEDCPGMPGVLFCDDFEDNLTKWTYPVHVRGTTAVTTDYQHGGSYAMRASSSASTNNQQAQARRGVTAFGHRKSGNLWARYFYYLPSTVVLTDKFSSGVISEYEDPWFGFSVLILPGGVGLENRDLSKTTDSITFPRDQWVCVEMHVRIDASAGMFEFFMDGNQIMSMEEINTVPTMGYTSFEVGVHYANFNQGAITVYTDDVKLGTMRLGCN